MNKFLIIIVLLAGFYFFLFRTTALVETAEPVQENFAPSFTSGQTQGKASDGSDKLLDQIRQYLPDVTAEDINPAAIDGIYQVNVGPRVFYFSQDARFLIDGEIIDLENKRNLTEMSLRQARLSSLKQIGESNMIIFAAEKPQHVITVFTDIDCAYCRKLHNDIEQYNQQGITVRYLLYPRAGVSSPSYQKAVSVWCAEDRRQALTRAKSGQSIAQLECENPVIRHMQLGRQMQIQGTPAIVLDSGRIIPGYVKAKALKAELIAQKQ